jgi:fructose-bisphosphate aldolase class I
MQDTVKHIMSDNRGVLALDWSPKTISKQFTEVGIVSTPELNRQYRQMLLTSPGIENYVSGVILHDETLHQKMDSGKTFIEYLAGKGIIAGVRADDGTSKFMGTEQDLTEGLNGLDQRLSQYEKLGVKFTKWRAGIKISDLYPSKEFIEESVKRLVEFAQISHSHNMVPFVEPDIEIKGNHTTTRCAETSASVLAPLFESLTGNGVDLTKVILKTNMVMPGVDSGVIANPLEVANATLAILRKTVPAEVGGIVFLSGGQSYDDSVQHLDKIEDLSKDDPWKLSFSYARSLQKDALSVWAGNAKNADEAQKVLITRLQKVCKARMGEL